MNEKCIYVWAFQKQVSVLELNHRLNGDKSPRRSINHVQGRIFGMFEQILKTRKIIHNLNIYA